MDGFSLSLPPSGCCQNPHSSVKRILHPGRAPAPWLAGSVFWSILCVSCYWTRNRLALLIQRWAEGFCRASHSLLSGGEVVYIEQMCPSAVDGNLAASKRKHSEEGNVCPSRKLTLNIVFGLGGTLKGVPGVLASDLRSGIYNILVGAAWPWRWGFWWNL